MRPHRPVPRRRRSLAVSGITLVGLLITNHCGGHVPSAAPPAPAPVASTPSPTPDPSSAAPPDEPAAATALEPSAPDEDELVADDLPTADPGAPAGAPLANPLDGWTNDQIADAVRNHPERLGSVSIGSPNAGRLWGGVPMPEGDGWVLVDPAHAYGTEESVAAIVAAIGAVRAEFPDTAPLRIGHLSGREGGYLSPHLSHQSGRDADLGYYYVDDRRWYSRATAANLDRARTWALVRALLSLADVEMILIDRSLQGLLRAHALEIGEDPGWVDGVFRGGGGLPPLIRHAPGHATHLHVRFYSPVARETARRAQPAMIAAGVVDPPVVYVTHRARTGDTLGKLAKRYGTTVQAIQRANGLRSTVILARRTYRIPQPGVTVAPPGPVTVPRRRVPPPRASRRDPSAPGNAGPVGSAG